MDDEETYMVEPTPPIKQLQQPKQLEDIEISLLLEGIYRHYGFNFREYAAASLKRRVLILMKGEGLASISELQARILHDVDVMEKFLSTMSISVTSMFRDPTFFVAFRNQVVPILKTYPYLKIWLAGCATGEEAYSMAILLEEENLLDKTTIYATDMDETVLQTARNGIFPLSAMKEYTKNYINAKGKRNFSDYYSAKYDHAIFVENLGNNIVFAKHNLATDQSFNEFNVIICRNVMIYFNQDLQNKVLSLFYRSLCRFGVLGLGLKETLRFSAHEHEFEPLCNKEKIYRRQV